MMQTVRVECEEETDYGTMVWHEYVVVEDGSPEPRGADAVLDDDANLPTVPGVRSGATVARVAQGRRAMMPPEYDEWVNRRYEELAAVAKARVAGTKSFDAYEIVDTVVMRAIASPSFPVNDESAWWAWHCRHMRSVVSNQLRADLRHRANAAQEGAGVILSEAQRAKAGRLRLQVHPHTIRRKYPKPRWPFAKFIYVQTILSACGCGAPVRWRLDRDPSGDWVPSLECWNGHHIKQEAICPS